MTESFLGQIVLTGFNFTMDGFATCSGQMMPLQQHIALFSLLGTTYGGNGINMFGLPNFHGRVPVGAIPHSKDPAWQPTIFPLGAREGVESTPSTGQKTANGNTSRENTQPFGAVNFCIALTGEYPSR